MKKLAILLTFALIAFATSAQYNKIPPSFTWQQTTKERLQTAQKLSIPFKVEALKAEDEEMKGLGFPERIAKTIPVAFTPQNAGEWTTLPDGQRIWLLEIEAPGAGAMALLYDEFIIPQGGKLYIYDTNLTEVNVYTDADNAKKAEYSTSFISGDKVRLEYVPNETNSGEPPKIKVSGIAYAYKNVRLCIAQKFKDAYEKQIGDAAPCEINVNCEQGNDWYHQKNGVATTIQVLSGGVYLCSGTVINNTLNDRIPYFLMAYHCGGEATDAQFNQWQFYFNFERTGCSENSPLADYHIMTGATKRVALPMDGESDGLLLELNQPIPGEWGVFYNGWDRRKNATAGGAAIHHPKGDLKKISLYSVTPSSYTVHMVDGEVGAGDAHWSLYFNQGIIEGGSSGSPLFNSAGRVIGTLTGSSQNLNCDNPFLDAVYGKMSWHWDQSPDPAHRMAHFLDPDNSGVEYIDGTYGGGIQMNFKASSTNIYASEEVIFINRSFGDIDTYVWNFEGGEPSTYTGENPPTVTYMNEGTFNVGLTGKKGDEIAGSCTVPIQVSIKQEFCRPGEPIAIGNGTSVSAFPLGATYRHMLDAAIYTAEELGLTKKGLITGLKWNSSATPGVRRTIEIYLKETDRSTFGAPSTWSTEIAQATLVYSGTINANTAGADTFTLKTPFVYSGEKHLKVLVHANSEPGSSSGCTYTAGQANSNQQWISTLTVPLYQNTNGQLNANRPDITFHYDELCDVEMPTAKFDFSPSTVYEGDSVKFNDFSTGPVVRRKWNFPGGNPATSVQPSPSVIYMNEGVYDVSLFAVNHLGTDSLILSGAVTVQARRPIPQFFSFHNGLTKHADFGPFLPPTDNASVRFENQSLNYPKSIAWTFEGGNPETSAEKTPLVQYPAGENKYDVKLAVSNSAGTADTTLTGYVQTGGTAEIWNIQQGESPSERRLNIGSFAMLAEKFTALSGGKISQVKVHTIKTGQKTYDMTLAIYSDNHGLPGTMISPVLTIPDENLVLNGYNTFKFETPVIVPETFHIAAGVREFSYEESYYSVPSVPNRANGHSTASVYAFFRENGNWYDTQLFGLSTSSNIVPEFTYNSTTGIPGIKDRNGTLKVYPNPSPASARFYVVSGLNEPELTDAFIEVYNLLGALVHRQKATGKTTEMNLSQKGIYLIRLKGENVRIVIN